MAKAMGSFQDGFDTNMHVWMQDTGGRVADAAVCGSTETKTCLVATGSSRFVILSKQKICPVCVQWLERSGQVLATVEEFDAWIGPENAALRRSRPEMTAFLASEIYIRGGS